MIAAILARKLKRLAPQLAALVLILAADTLVAPGFLHISVHNGRLYGSLIDILVRAAPVAILAIGMTLVIATRGIDLSVGAVMAISGAVAASLIVAGYPLAAVGVELDAIAAVVIGGTLLSGGVGTVFGSLFGVLIQGLIQTYINFDGTLSSWWTKIIIGLLLFSFIALQRLLILVSEHRKANKPGPFKRQVAAQPE